MTLLLVCPKCGGEFHAYDNGNGIATGRCHNCGTTHTYGLTASDKRDAELLANHLRGSRA